MQIIELVLIYYAIVLLIDWFIVTGLTGNVSDSQTNVDINFFRPDFYLHFYPVVS